VFKENDMKRILILILTVNFLFLNSCANSPEDTIEHRIARVEQGLLSESSDPKWKKTGLEDRMEFYNVPGVSVAVINDYQIEWVKGYGVLDKDSNEPVSPETIFQTGSIAKSVVAVAALHYSAQGFFDLDKDVNNYLTSWTVPVNSFMAEENVTLRRLLSHHAGVTVHGYRGYSQGEAIPNLQQVLDGAPPANSPPVQVDIVPGSKFRYSGGGYMIVQQLLEDTAQTPFSVIMQNTVLEPWKMNASTFDSPLPEFYWTIAATGHRADGQPIPGRWHTYPEMGSGASMWSTPSDMANFAIKLMLAYQGQPDSVLSKEMAFQMLSPEEEGLGLGVYVGNDGGDLFYFFHDGANDGYKSYMVAYLERGQGVIILTNGDNGDALGREILNSVSVEYGWFRDNTLIYLGSTMVIALVLVGILFFRRISPGRKIE
jgi:CubicO group peptidase (beta-lactamase class C family)